MIKLPEKMACPSCGANNRVGLSLCMQCMRPLPNKEERIEEIKKAQEKEKSKSTKKMTKPSYRINLMDLED